MSTPLNKRKPPSEDFLVTVLLSTYKPKRKILNLKP